jgi:hypothetical protein
VAELTFAFDRISGRNGDELQMTITDVHIGAQEIGGATFVLMSSRGDVHHYAAGYVTGD